MNKDKVQHEPAPSDKSDLSTRRQFLRGAGTLSVQAAGFVTVSQLLAGSAEASTKSSPVMPLADGEGQDPLLRMQHELRRAMAKPIEQRRWGMVIDTRKCVGCHSCTVGCVVENKLPPGVVYRPVIDTEVGTYPNVRRRFLPRPCMQCDNPPCVPVCPVKATWKRADGIVVIDYNACIGCRYCITACPYQARTFDFGENWADNAAKGQDDALALRTGRDLESEPNFEYGKPWTRKESLFDAFSNSPIGNARKCHFCAHRLEVGMLPMCATTCIGRATFFGDLNDPQSLVSELSVLNNATRLKEEVGTEPKVFYLV